VVATIGFFAFMAYAAGLIRRLEQTGGTGAVRRTVKQLIVGFIVIDACGAAASSGVASGLAVLALVIPTLIAARQAPMT
jgi:hypothetical protein